MPIRLSCSGCGQKLSAPLTYAGRRVPCPKCKTLIVVDTAEPMAATSPAPPATDDDWMPREEEQEDPLAGLRRDLGAVEEPELPPARFSPPPMQPARLTRTVTPQPAATVSVPSYILLNILGVTLTVVGLLAAGIGLLVLGVALTAAFSGSPAQRSGGALAVIILASPAMSMIVGGLLLGGVGQAFNALRDIAINSWEWRTGERR